MKFPSFVQDRRFVVIRGKKPVAAFYVVDKATDYADRRNARTWGNTPLLWVWDRYGKG